MIRDIIAGDITAENNRSDIIIGMNAELISLKGIGYSFVKQIKQLPPIQLGSVLSLDFDRSRKLHMIICHRLGPNGWYQADKYVRIGLDHLWQQDQQSRTGREYSCVRIGTGVMGKKYKASVQKIHAAIANSFLELDLYIWLPDLDAMFLGGVLERSNVLEMRMWTPDHGEQKIPAVN